MPYETIPGSSTISIAQKYTAAIFLTRRQGKFLSFVTCASDIRSRTPSVSFLRNTYSVEKKLTWEIKRVESVQ